MRNPLGSATARERDRPACPTVFQPPAVARRHPAEGRRVFTGLGYLKGEPQIKVPAVATLQREYLLRSWFDFISQAAFVQAVSDLPTRIFPAV